MSHEAKDPGTLELGGIRGQQSHSHEGPRPTSFSANRSSRVTSSYVAHLSQPPPTFEAVVSKLITEPEQINTAAGRRSLLAAVAGTILEFYDFSVFAYFSSEIGKNFFPGGDPTAQSIKTFSVFGAGFAVRPLGSVVLGMIGDRYGTEAALIISIALMVAPTLALGFLPTYSQVGIWAPVGLLIVRVLQGLSVGGEYVGAFLHTADNNSKDRLGFLCGIVSACGVVGKLMGSIVAIACQKSLTKAEMLKYGWRIPFWAGSVLGLVGLFLRLSRPPRDPDTAVVTEEEEEPPQTFGELLTLAAKTDKLKALKVTLFVSLFSTQHYIVYAWLKEYMEALAPRTIPKATAASVVAVLQVILIFSQPFWGWVGDRYKIRQTYIRVAVLMNFLVSAPTFLLLSYGRVDFSWTYAVVAGVLWGFILSGNNYAWVTETMEGTPSRFTVTAVAFNLGTLIGGLYPIAAAALTRFKDVRVAPVLPLAGLALITLTLLCLPQGKPSKPLK